jgi:hypothetical protein
VVTVTASNPLDQSSSIGPIDTGITAEPLPAAVSAAQSTVVVSIPTTVSVRQAQGADSPEPVPQPGTELSSVAPGETITLPLTPTITTTLDAVGETGAAAAASVAPSSATSAAAIASQPTSEETTAVQGVGGPEASPPSETASESTSAGPLDATTVTPLANTPDAGAENPSATPTPTPIPSVSVLQPEAGDEATSGIAAPTNEQGSEGGMTITIGDLSIVIHSGSGPATTAAGNSVVPVLGALPTTVTVTTTVTAA